MNSPQIVQAQDRTDARGGLSVFDPLPFTPARAFVIHDTAPEAVRGGHAHKTLTQGIVAIGGSARLMVIGLATMDSYDLTGPSQILVVPPMHWVEIAEIHGSLLVLADAPYDEADYVRVFDDFVAAELVA